MRNRSAQAEIVQKPTQKIANKQSVNIVAENCKRNFDKFANYFCRLREGRAAPIFQGFAESLITVATAWQEVSVARFSELNAIGNREKISTETHVRKVF